ncbi:MAG: cobalt-precorrin-5B (C(1))-methyltransferase [Archaeoglobaceae archaeon]|nr:cobalt-precorrin-5B (C(1))-methyltransferase [Archaeoglobaceae archaeon]MCX8152501.1 cobalt-precorrin-5B (C(1))-methyltransferase [Archaeoglobaceae archaeon]MDW8013684.1 cobalt-precorrin-5B (C(1))-methyltransferase [Archaeoglobaceae archaeon]
MQDPIELYSYPKDWIMERKRRGEKRIEEKIYSGLYILTPEGWLRRGITTATAASAAMIAAMADEELDFVKVKTPVGIEIKVPTMKRKNSGIAMKFSGDHGFDATSSTIFVAIKKEIKNNINLININNKIFFGKNVSYVSDAAKKQLMENYKIACEKYDCEESIFLDAIFRGKSEKIEGLAILGTTGFVEPWCDELVKAKILIAKQYDKIAVTTGRESWKLAREIYKDYQPFVFGVHLKEIISSHDGEIVIVGKPGLLKKVFGFYDKDKILKEARNVSEVFIC